MLVSWTTLKSFATDRNIASLQYVQANGKYVITAIDSSFQVTCNIPISTPPGADQSDFEENYLPNANQTPKIEVVTQYELNNKTLRCLCAFNTTNSNGTAIFAIPIPGEGRWVAYGDAEFEVRHMGDYVSKVEVRDLDREIAWGLALAQDPNAQAPLDDSVVISLGDQVPGGPFPLYPIVNHYDEKELPNPLPENAIGDIKGGMSMTFQYGNTEVQPVGGYGFIPGGLYLYIEVQKAAGHTAAGQMCAVSVDLAEND